MKNIKKKGNASGIKIEENKGDWYYFVEDYYIKKKPEILEDECWKEILNQKPTQKVIF